MTEIDVSETESAANKHYIWWKIPSRIIFLPLRDNLGNEAGTGNKGLRYWPSLLVYIVCNIKQSIFKKIKNLKWSMFKNS